MSQKILIVDDEPHIRMLLEQTLDELVDEGVEVFLATNGQEGLDAVAAERRRIERNIHDGVQQRLVALGIDLGLVAFRCGVGGWIHPSR